MRLSSCVAVQLHWIENSTGSILNLILNNALFSIKLHFLISIFFTARLSIDVQQRNEHCLSVEGVDIVDVQF
jgi:hypothetical protein